MNPSFVALGLLAGTPGQAATPAPLGMVAIASAQAGEAQQALVPQTPQTTAAESTPVTGQERGSSAPELSDPLADPASGAQTLAPSSDTPADPADPAAASPVSPPPVIVAAHGHAPGDPLEHFNRRMFRIHEGIDHAAIRPVAMGYKHVVPKFMRSGFRHVLSNLFEPIVFLNDLLQLKPGRAVKTLARFVINTGYGLGGLIDVAKNREVGLPYRHNGFGDTLGYYGVKPGPYLFLPFVGPTDLRDVLGGQVDGAVLPVSIGFPFNQASYQIPSGAVSGLDQRAEADGDLNALFDSSVDPYATLRSVYLQDRAGEIAGLHSRHVVQTRSDDELQDPLADPAAGSAAPASDPAAATAPDAGTAQSSSSPELSDPLADPAAAPAPAK